MWKESSLDFITQPRSLLNYGSAFSRSQSIARKNGINPNLAETTARGTAKLSSANPKKSQLVFKQQIDPYSAHLNPITRGFKTPSRIKMSSKKDEELELFKKWKSNPTSDNLRPLLSSFNPIITQHVNKWQDTGINKDILRNEAQNLFLKSLQTYDPKKNVQLSTHVINNLKPMSRFAANNQNIIRIPEQNLQEYRKLLTSGDTNVDLKKTLEKESKGNLASHKTFTEHFYSMTGPNGNNPVMEELSSDAMALSMLYDELDKTDKIIFRHTFGYNNTPILSNKDIAKKLGISPPAVTKRKNKIEEKYRTFSQSIGSIWS